MKVSSRSVEVVNTGVLISQRAFAKSKSYGSTRGSNDTVMLLCKDMINSQIDGLEESKVFVRFGKVIFSHNFCKAKDASSRCSVHENRAVAVFSFDSTSELCFMKWYEVIGIYALSVDDIDSALRCFRMRWHRNWWSPMYTWLEQRVRSCSRWTYSGCPSWCLIRSSFWEHSRWRSSKKQKRGNGWQW